MLALGLLLLTQIVQLLIDLLVAHQGGDKPLVAEHQLGNARHMVGKPGLDVVGHDNPHQTLVSNVDVFGQHRLQCHEIRIAVSAQDQLEIPGDAAGDEFCLVLQ
ncbi:hypothetical protein D3C85_952890 [compost metagenome]